MTPPDPSEVEAVARAHYEITRPFGSLSWETKARSFQLRMVEAMREAMKIGHRAAAREGGGDV